MERQTKLVGITSACIDCVALGTIEGEKCLHLEVADIAGEPTHPQKRCVPTLHREPQKWEATIPVYKANRKDIAAVIVEPFSGSAGVVVPPMGYLQRLREICTQQDILLIFDEVITAFGRTGCWTGAEAFGVTPDIMTMAKQITNGTQPLGAVVVKQEIHDVFMRAGGPSYMLEFPHGYTYSAHPVACAAALASLQLLEEEAALERVRELAPRFEEAVHSLRAADNVADIRNFGLAAGITVASAPGEPALRPYNVAMAMYRKGFYVRYGGDTIQIAPPFISTPNEIDRLVNALGDTFNETD